MVGEVLFREFISLVKWVAVGYLLITAAIYHLDILNKKLEMRRVKSNVISIKAAGATFDKKLREFVDFLIKETERPQR